MILQKYESYKDSGVEWLGEIPGGWEIRRLKDFFNQISGSSDQLEPETYIPLENIESFTGRLLKKSSNEDGETTSLFRKGDLLFNKLRPYLGKIIECEFNGGVSGEAIVLRVKNSYKSSVFTRYFFYRLLSTKFIFEVNSLTKGVKMPRTNPNVILALEIGYTQKKEQIQISNFLDKKTSQIDSQIKLLQNKISNYEELKKSLINETVCKGLDKDVELKDSGIEWLGDIPREWKVKRGKDLFRLSNFPAKKNHKLQLLSVYAALGVRPRKSLEQRGNKATNIDEYWIVKKNDIVVNKLLAWMGAIGLSKYDGVTSPAYDILRKKIPLNERYYELFFRTKKSQIEFKQHSRGILEIRLRLYNDRFNQISFPYPNKNIQDNIVNYLDKKTTKIDNIISKIKDQIETLKEFRKTVINDVVTGKVRVQNE